MAELTTTFDTVRDLIYSECVRGDSVLPVLDSKIQQAVGFIERNYTLKYMERLVRFSLLPGSTAPGPYEMPSRLKSVVFMRLVNVGADGSARYDYLTKMESPADHMTTVIGPPTRFWEDGNTYFWFNGIVQDEVPVDLLYNKFTGRLLEDSFCWLFDYGLDAVVAKTMQLMSPWLRQPNIMPAYQLMWQEGINTLLSADSESRLSSTAVTFGELADA